MHHQDRLAPAAEASVIGRFEDLFQLRLFWRRQPDPPHRFPPLVQSCMRGYLKKDAKSSAACISVVVLQETLCPEQHVLAAVSHHHFEPCIPQATDYRAVVTHQELATAGGVAWMLGEYGRECATMPGVFQGDKRA